MSDNTNLEERLRATYEKVGTLDIAPPPVLVTDASDARHEVHRRTRPLLVAGVAVVVVLALVIGIAALRDGSSPAPSQKQLHPVDQQKSQQPVAGQPLFPNVVPHHGADLLLAPQYVPDGYHLLYATGPDKDQPGSSSGGGNGTTQTWVKLDATGTQPVAGFTLGWGPQDLADNAPPHVSMGHQDALSAYANAEAITVNGNPGVWAEYLQTVAWEQDGRALAIAGNMDNWTGTWVEHLTRDELQAMADSVVRLPDGTYQLTAPVPGYQLVATTAGTLNTGTYGRRLVYTDGNGHGYSIQLVDDTGVPPGYSLGANARLVEVRGQRAITTPFLNGGDGGACSQIDMFLCAGAQPGVLNANYVQWLEPDSTRVTLSGVGIDPAELLRIARSLTKVSADDWAKLTAPTKNIPCAQLANCK